MSEVVLGFVDFDERIDSSSSNTCTINVSEEKIDRVFRGKFVKIRSTEGRVFVGRVVAGPFYKPEGLSPSSSIAKAFTVRGEFFQRPPPFYASFSIEILGELKRGRLESTYTRPKPKSPVIEVASKEIESILGFRGDMVLGYIIGYKGVKLRFSSGDPNFLPRNVGIFGTVGSGKTNTAQVLIEEALSGGWSVFVLDVEGEYTYMDNPSDDDLMVRVLKSTFGVEPEGVKDFQVYVPRGRSSYRSDAREFGVMFEDINPYVFAELIDATEAQQRYLSSIVDELRERSGRREVGDELEDLVLGSPPPKLTLQKVISEIEDRVESAERFMRSSLMALSSKLERLDRLGFIDASKPLPVRNRMKPGALTVIDLSDVEDRVKNIVIAWLLDKVFSYKLSGLETKTMVVIEEAHTFVSAEARDKMAATLDMLKVVARRGRKRWMSLVFVSQQPGHLPAEIFELCNTRIVHSLRSEINIRAIRRTSGGVTEEHIGSLTGMSPGEALIISPTLLRPQLARIRPARTRKLRFS